MRKPSCIRREKRGASLVGSKVRRFEGSKGEMLGCTWAAVEGQISKRRRAKLSVNERLVLRERGTVKSDNEVQSKQIRRASRGRPGKRRRRGEVHGSFLRARG